MDPLLAACILLGGSLALLGLFFGYGAWCASRESARSMAELALARHIGDAAAALAAERLDALNEAKLLLVSRARSAQEDVDRAAALDAALSGAPAGDELAAVDRLLRARAGARRAGPSEPPGEAPASGDGHGAPGLGGTG